jgi:hypothetical protein
METYGTSKNLFVVVCGQLNLDLYGGTKREGLKAFFLYELPRMI